MQKMALNLLMASGFYNLLLSLDEPEMERISFEEAENTLGGQLEKVQETSSHCLSVLNLN